jgi:hypothetical protein
MDFSEPFREEIDRLAAAGVKPDIALLPIVACGPGDAEAVELGVHYVLKTLKPRAFLPMHCGGSEHLGCEFVKECAGAFPGTAMAAPENRGDRFRYRGGAIERL